MGAMKELMIESTLLEQEWLDLVHDILELRSLGQVVGQRGDFDHSDRDEWEAAHTVPDFTIRSEGKNEKIAVEFKMFRWRSDWNTRARDAVNYLRDLMRREEFDLGIVIVSLELEDAERTMLDRDMGDWIYLWDLKDLRGRAKENVELLNRLDELASLTVLDRDQASPAPRQESLGKGAMIAESLRRTEPGLNGWQDFEKLCHEALKFLFGRELHNLLPQARSHDDLHRMDLIGRIRPANESFWAIIASDFATRYIVFEAKNSSKKIGQSAIDITSKYLFRHGRRNVAIVIARMGASESALQESAGLLRETGKLILIISLEDVCTMLEGADRGDAPGNLLFDRLDQTLMSIGR